MITDSVWVYLVLFSAVVWTLDHSLYPWLLSTKLQVLLKILRLASNLTEGGRLFIIHLAHNWGLYEAHYALVSSSSAGEVGVWPTSPSSNREVSETWP